MIPLQNSIHKMDLLQRPGDVNIKDVRIISPTGFEISIWSFVEQLDIYEDIFANTLKGEVAMVESYNLPQHVPILGFETLRVIFGTPSCPDVTAEFRIYKVSSRILGKQDRTQAYSLCFASRELVTNTQVLVSESYDNKRADEIVGKIFNDYLLPSSPLVRVTRAKDRHHYVIPYWSPLYAINWLTSRSQSETNPDECDFMFYQTLDGYNFVPLSELKRGPVVQEYVYYPANVRDPSGERDIDKEFRNVMSYTILESHDKMMQCEQGMFASTLLTHDIVRKKWEYTTFSYRETFPKTKHLESHPVIPYQNESVTQTTDSRYKYLPKHSHRHDGYVDNEKFEDWSLQRSSLIEQALAIRVQLEVPGDSRRRVGDVVQFELPSPEVNANKDQWTDLYLNGKFLITSIRHRIRHDDYTCFIEIAKDSFQTPAPDQKSNMTRHT